MGVEGGWEREPGVWPSDTEDATNLADLTVQLDALSEQGNI